MRTVVEGEEMSENIGTNELQQEKKKRENYINLLLFLRVERQLSKPPPTPRPQSPPPLPDEKNML